MSAGLPSRRLAERVRGSWPAFLLFVLAVFAYLLRTTSYLSAIPGDLGDSRFNSVILEHVYQWLTGEAARLWSPRFYYPNDGVLGYSDSHFGTVGVYIFMRLLGWGRENAFLGWYLFGCILNFWVTYFALRWLRFNAWSAAIGAFVFAFSLPVLAQESHSQLNYRFCVPLAYVAMHRFLAGNGSRFAVAIIPLVVWQFFISIYLGVFLVCLLGAFGLARLIVDGPRLGERWMGMRSEWKAQSSPGRWAIAAVTALPVIVLLGLLGRYHAIAKANRLLGVPADAIVGALPRPQSYLSALTESARWMGKLLPEVPMPHEHMLFVGFSVLALLVVALCTLRRSHANAPTARAAAITLGIVIVVTLNIAGYSLYYFLAWLPGLSAVRAPSRVILVVLWPVAILAAYATQNIVDRVRRSHLPWCSPVFIVLAGLLALETYAAPSYSTPVAAWTSRQAAVEQLWSRKADIPERPILLLTGRTDEPRWFTELDAMIFSQDKRIPTLNGYSGYAPPGYMLLDRCTPTAVLLNSYATAGKRPLDASGKSKFGPQSIVRLALEPCPIDVGIDPPPNIQPEQASAIRVRFGSVKRQGQNIGFSVSLTNSGSTVFNTQSGSGHPVDLAWRIVRGTDSQDLSAGWNDHQTIGFALAPGETRELQVSSLGSAESGGQVLQVTLVEENLAWLHALGLKVASFELPGN